MLDNNPAPFFAINFLCFALAWLIASRSDFFRHLLAEPSPGRTAMLDGLRGWLALGVFFAHAVVMRNYLLGGKWGESPAWLYGMAGQIGVSLFFMITGFLFWRRVLRENYALDTASLLSSRIRRIVPMYLCSVFLSLLVIACLSQFTLQVSLVELIRQLRPWFSFGFAYAGEINGVSDAHYINAVYWTLAFEWGFYIALPLLALLARGRGILLLLPVAILYCLQAPVTLNFIAGAITAMLVEKNILREQLKSSFLTPIPLLALIAVFTLPSAYALLPVCLMTLFFFFIVGGNSLFGLLTSRPAKLLGTISYSIYLTHCILLYVVVQSVHRFIPVSSISLESYWLLAAFVASLCVIVSALTYHYVEHPFIARKPVAALQDKALEKSRLSPLPTQ